jgi:hypothetical protein
MPTTPTINFDRPKVARLRVALAAAQTQGQEQFTFEGHELLTTYAKYLLEYLDQRFEP